MIFIIDKGHGGNDPGVVYNGIKESDFTNYIGDKLYNKLSKYNITVKIAPRTSLSDRVNFANNLKASYFISIHVNGGGGTGFESYIYTTPTQKSIEYQNIIHNEIVKYLQNFNIRDRGKKRANFQVLRETNCPSILLENLFLDNINDIKYLKDEKFIDGLVDSITNGIVKCFNLKLKTDYIGHYHEDDIKWVKEMGIMKGYSETIFKPDEPVTNARLAAILKRFYSVIKEGK